MDEYEEINLAVVQTEYERMRDPNLDDTPSNGCGCLSLSSIGWIIGGLLILRCVAELFS